MSCHCCLLLRWLHRVNQVGVVLRAEVWAEWFAILQDHNWSCCFLRKVRDHDEAGVVILHHGARRGAFRTVMAEMGVVMK